MQELGRRGINEVHAEAGFKLNGSLVRERCVDELLVYVAPSLVGEPARGCVGWHEALTSLDDRVRLSFDSVERVGDDLRIRARVQRRE